jgi:hypothetical protein
MHEEENKVTLKVKYISGYKTPPIDGNTHPEISLYKAIPQIKNEWWMSSGTALGLYRDGDFIVGDTDIDVGVRAKRGQEHIKIDGLRLCRTMEWGDLPIQTAYFDDENKCIFDIGYYYEDLVDGKLISVSEYGSIYYDTPYIIKPSFIIEWLPTKYGNLPFPHPIETYLKNRFGEFWETPKKNSKGIYYKNLTDDIN